MEREDVYKLIDGERDYQDSKWPEPRPMDDNITPVAAWILYMEHHIQQAKFQIYILDESAALEHIRKIAGLGVACMEHNTTKPRIIEQ